MRDAHTVTPDLAPGRPLAPRSPGLRAWDRIPGIPRGVSVLPSKDSPTGLGSWRWTAHWCANGKRFYRHFPILTLGWEAAFWMAVVARRAVTPKMDLPKRCPPIPEHIARWIEDSTPSTMGGVRLVPAQSGGMIHAWSWYAIQGSGRVTFSILKYGYEEAHRLACASRRDGVPCDLPDPPVPPMTDAVRDWIARRNAEIAASSRAKAAARQPASPIDAAHAPASWQNIQQKLASASRQRAPTRSQPDRTQVPHLQTLPCYQWWGDSAAWAFDVDTIQAGDLDALVVDGPETSVMLDSSRAAVRAAIDAAPMGDRSRKIINLRFGFDCDDHTLDDIGQMFGVTRERIRQLETEALKMLKRVFVGQGLGPEIFDSFAKRRPATPLSRPKP